MPSIRARQTRLAFSPLPSSSPAAKGYHQQIQDRAAAVTLHGTPGRMKRRVPSSAGAVSSARDSMPTAAATYEREKGDRMAVAVIPSDDEDSDDLPSQPTRKRRKTSRQQRIDFSNVRDPESFDSPVRLTSSAKPQSSNGRGVFGSRKGRAMVISSGEEESADDEESKSGNVSKRAKRKARAEVKKTRKSARLSSPIRQDDEDHDDRRAVSSPRRLPLPVELDGDDDDDEDDMPSTLATQRRKRTRSRRLAAKDDFISSSPPGPIDSDDDLQIIEKPTTSQRNHQELASGEDDDEPVTPGRRALKRSRHFSKQEADDLADDLDFLGPSSDVEEPTRKPRNTQTTQKAARLSALEKLKQKRSSQPSRSQPIIVEDDEGEDGEEEEDADSPAEFDEEDGDSDVEETEQPAISSRHYFTQNQEDEDFIEEASDHDPLGMPDPNIPIHLTRFATDKPKDLFPYAVEWMVQKKINPAFSMTDELYALTFQKLDDEAKGLAGSKFISSAWTPQFTFALRARPQIAYDSLDRSGEDWMNDHCDACNRSGHPSTFRLQFQGKPYYRETLDNVAQRDEDDEDDSDSDTNSDEADDQPAKDSDGREIVPTSKVFFVGKFCMANAQAAHALGHWKYHLNEWVVDWLKVKGYLRPAEIVKRDEMSEKRRRKVANKIVDRMEQEGAIKQLWTDFKRNVEDARDSKQGRF